MIDTFYHMVGRGSKHENRKAPGGAHGLFCFTTVVLPSKPGTIGASSYNPQDTEPSGG